MAGLYVQREAVAHTPARRVPGILAQDPLLAGYLGGEQSAPAVEIHSHVDFRPAYIDYAVRNGLPRERAVARALFVHAFTDRDTDIIHLDRERGDPGTIVHEALHLHSSRSFIEQVHPNVNEGATEYFTRRVCATASIERGEGSYPSEFGAVRLLVDATSPEALALAYFRNDTSQLEAALEARRAGLWIDWLIAMTRGTARANALLGGDTAENDADAAASTG